MRTIISFLFIISFAFSTLINVPDEFSTIQAAISFSSDGDTILVHPGTHFGGVNYIGRDILIGSLFIIDGNEDNISNTIIEGGARRGSNAIIFESGETEAAQLIGFTITGGTAGLGGGIHCSSSSSPTLSHLIVTGNHANAEGGGLYCQSSELTITNTIFINNDAEGSGGGLHGDNCTLTMRDVIISENISGGHGAGIYLTGGITDIRNTQIYGNDIIGSSGYYGGGIHDDSITSIYDHVSISDNTTLSDAGGGMYCKSNAELINATFSGNEANGMASAIYFTETYAVMQNCIVWGNIPNNGIAQVVSSSSANVFVHYSNVEYGWLGEGINNIDINPMFTDPISNDYSLQQNSPCIDAGNPDIEYYDPDGTQNDMGAFYYHQESGCMDESAVNYNSDAIVDDGSCIIFIEVQAGDYTFGEGDTLYTIYYDFDIGQFEITNKQYCNFLNDAGNNDIVFIENGNVYGYYSGDDTFPSGNYLLYDLISSNRIQYSNNIFEVIPGYDNHPVVFVTWFGANAFADFYSVRLPTEFEWEKTARGCCDGRTYPWGEIDPTCQLANFYSCGAVTKPVGQTTGNSPFGAEDMTGNVLEWNSNLFGNPYTGYRSVRGGSFASNIDYLQTWRRDGRLQDFNDSYIGFRVAMPVSGCTDDEACNFIQIATIEDGSCLYNDCNGDCGGTAFLDDCGDCTEGNTGLIANSDDSGCGCGVSGPSVFFVDDDDDGIGYAEGVLFCEEMGPNTPNTDYELVPDGWVLTENDNCPYTYNPDQADVDDDGMGDNCDDIYNGQVYLGFGEVDLSSQDYGIVELVYNSDVEIQSVIVQITELQIIDVDTSLEDFIVTLDDESGFINIFSFSGDLLPVTGGEDDVFATVQYEYEPDYYACLDNPTVTAPPGYAIEVTLGDCSIEPDPPLDCAGEFLGSAIVDDCGVCSGGTTDHEANSDMDCAGVCFGDSYEDLCIVCDDNPDNDNETCSGCTDETSLNYDPEAIVDDGSCQFPDIIVPDDFALISDAYASASANEIIFIRPGVYYENIILTSSGESAVQFVGSGQGETIIDGMDIGRVVWVQSGINTEHPLIFRDMTLRNGNAENNGSGMYVEYANVALSNIEIKDCGSSTLGGGMVIRSSEVSMTQVFIHHNFASHNGGGINIDQNSFVVINNSIIQANEADYGGGIMCDQNTTLRISNSILVNNESESGGALYVGSPQSRVYIVNSILSNNSASSHGGGISSQIGTVALVNSIVYDNGYNNISGIIIPSFSDIEYGSYWMSDWSIDLNPMFIDDNQFYLSLDSPCIDAGTQFFVFEGDTLIDLQPGEYEGFAPDMGVHETSQTYLPQPEITTIEDVPDDQGGQLLLQFQRSFYDRDGLNRSNETYTVERWSELPNGDSSWVNVISGTAYGENSYAYLVPTTIDSSLISDGISQYRVIAGMDEGNWGSDTMSSYSVDNIAPAVPTGLLALVDEGTVGLSWDDPVDEDFQYFSIYRAGELIEFTVESQFTDTDPPSIGLITYDVTATDAHGNEGDPSADVTISMEAVTGDFNMDYQINVVDVVELVYIILYGIEPTPIQLQTGDIDNNGVLNVVDVVHLVDLILNLTYSKGQSISHASVTVNPNALRIDSDGQIAGIQLEVEGNYQIEENRLPDGWELYQGYDRIIMISLDGSRLQDEKVFTYSGELKVSNAVIADWHGSDVKLNVITIPSEYGLSPAYPNPFNPITTINYQLPIDTHLRMSVYNMLGQEVALLLDVAMFAGSHSVNWNATNYPSGIYLIRMVTDKYSSTSKVMLLK